MLTTRCAALCAALFLFWAQPLLAQDVTLISRDGEVELSGTLMRFDGEFYRLRTDYGELTVDGSGVSCAGPGCPNLEDFVAEIALSGSATMGAVLMPALIDAFARQNGYAVTRESREETRFELVLTRRETGKLAARSLFRATNTDAGFADLLADAADIVMALREIRPEERSLARSAGMGDLTGLNRSRVLALDAVVAVVAPANPIKALSPRDLARVRAGEIDNWQALGGPDAPIAVHVHGPRSGLGQATEDRLLKPAFEKLLEAVTFHPAGPGLARSVAADPFAIGVTSRSETDAAWELAIRGECGFELRAGRQAVKTEDYPLTSPMFLYLPARRFPKLVREFLSYLRDPSAQLVMRRAGFVDQAPEEIAIHQQGDRFANAIARAGEETQLEELQRMVSFLTPLKRLTTTFRFETGSVRLDAQSRSNVQQLARAMEVGLYDSRRLVFVGFSDSDGAAAANLKIAQRRADAVRDAVVEAAETANLSRIGLETEAFGEAMPMACDDSAWGRQINRRVEVWVR